MRYHGRARHRACCRERLRLLRREQGRYSSRVRCARHARSSMFPGSASIAPCCGALKCNQCEASVTHLEGGALPASSHATPSAGACGTAGPANCLLFFAPLTISLTDSITYRTCRTLILGYNGRDTSRG